MGTLTCHQTHLKFSLNIGNLVPMGRNREEDDTFHNFASITKWAQLNFSKFNKKSQIRTLKEEVWNEDQAKVSPLTARVIILGTQARITNGSHRNPNFKRRNKGGDWYVNPRIKNPL